MASRKPFWVVFVDGPLAGEKRLLPPRSGDTVNVLGHEYRVTTDRITDRQWQAQQKAAGNEWAMSEGGGWVARYVQSPQR